MKEGVVLSNSIRKAVFEAICKGENYEIAIRKMRIPKVIAEKELKVLISEGLISVEEGKYVPTEEGRKVYEKIKGDRCSLR